MTVLFKTNPVLWDQNESSGYRNIQVEYKGNTIVSVVANKTLGEWTCQVVPMGYSYRLDEVEFLANLYSQMQFIMNFLCTDTELTHDDVINLLDNLHV